MESEKSDNSTHNNINVGNGNNNKFGNVSVSGSNNHQNTQPKSDKPKTNFFLSIIKKFILKKLNF